MEYTIHETYEYRVELPEDTPIAEIMDVFQEYMETGEPVGVEFTQNYTNIYYTENNGKSYGLVKEL